MNMFSTRVLVVQSAGSVDNVTVVELLNQSRKPKYEVEFCDTFELAQERIEAEDHAVYLIDESIGGHSGLELLQWAQTTREGITFIMLLEHGDRKLERQALETGASDCLVKDKLDLQRLNQSIRNGILRNKAELRLKQLNRELQERNRHLQTLAGEKNCFIAIASHDLRTPLAVINGICSIMLEGLSGSLTPEQRAFVEQVQRTGVYMLELVNGILDVSVIESGELNLNLRPTNLCALIEQTLLAYGPVARRKNIRLKWHCVAETQHLLVLVDPERMTQVVDNLLSNAIKYSRVGATVQTSLVGGNDHLELIFEDQGEGIPEAELPNLFKPSGLSSNLPTGGERSTGLGLSIAKRIVESLGGTIRVESTVGVGTTFTVQLSTHGNPISATHAVPERSET